MCLEKHSARTDKRRSFGLLVLRIGLGVIFTAHGLSKVQGMDGVVGYFATLGFAPFMAYLVSYAELLGGIALLLGVFTRLAAASLAAIMAVVLLFIKMSAPITGMGGNELELALFVSAVALAFMGGGHFSLGRTVCVCCKNGKCTSSKCACHVMCESEHCSGSCSSCDSCKGGVCMIPKK